MPFYEYECSSCKFGTEALQKVSDAPLRKCPSCGKNTLKKLISAPVFRLKGAGWYETDFKSDGEKKRNLAESAEAAEKAQNKDAPKTEAASESKTETSPKPEAEKSKPKPAVGTQPVAAKKKKPAKK